MRRPVRVLIVDDSALMRQMLSAILSSDPRIEVVDTAADPLIAREKIKTLNPDVVTLDVEMPRMNGLDFLAKIMTLRPTPVIMISSLTAEGTDASLRALELGAVDVVGKPTGFINEGMENLRHEIIEKILAAACSHVQSTGRSGHTVRHPRLEHGLGSDRVIAIGASTGGVPAIASILEAMPANAPPILIVQHMPEAFTQRFASRLDNLCDITIREGRDRQIIQSGHAYIAPGGRMMSLKGDMTLQINDSEKVNGFRPSVDVLFDSIAKVVGAKAIGVLLTGMGDDGARGLLRMRQSGAVTFGQDQASSIVYGMPRAAIQLGAVCQQLPIQKMAGAIVGLCRVQGVDASNVFNEPVT
ncbi:Protein-glutamate methylesterase/protein-glutamine glutaminase (plasmid) [Asticcacaulis sp. MM231]|uniref:protein-glutamate methylesterase/protein-glutamine glutaminase n=1 Tax=Asticcacaulis sp. MM231 TaxID=3157666 RepID=UPI0032D5A956